MIATASVDGAILGPVGLIVAFFVGTISFFSPCVLPLLPGYLSYVSGLSGEEMDKAAGRRRVVIGVSLFILGFALMFSAFGMVASVIGRALISNQTLVNQIAGVAVIVMGLAFIVPSLMPFLQRDRRPLLQRVRPGVAGAFPLGIAFAAGWTPCIGPGLGAMLNLGAVEGSVWRAGALLFSFSLGFGVWFMLAALGLRRAFSASGWLRRNQRVLQVVGGVFMVVIGVLLVTESLEKIMQPLILWGNRFTFV